MEVMLEMDGGGRRGEADEEEGQLSFLARSLSPLASVSLCGSAVVAQCEGLGLLLVRLRSEHYGVRSAHLYLSLSPAP